MALYDKIDELLFSNNNSFEILKRVLSILKIKENITHPVLLHQLLLALKGTYLDELSLQLLPKIIKVVTLKGYLPLSIAILKEFEHRVSSYREGIEILAQLYNIQRGSLSKFFPPPPLPPIPKEDKLNRDYTIQDIIEDLIFISDELDKTTISLMDQNYFVPSYPLFSELTQQEFVWLVSKLSLVTYEPDSVIITQGEYDKNFFIIARGAAEVIQYRDEGEKIVAQLGPGQFFGEMAIISSKPRQATVKATSYIFLLKMEEEILKELLSTNSRITKIIKDFAKERLLQNLINYSPIFNMLPKEERLETLKQFTLKEYKENTTIIKQGEEGESLFLVFEGEVDVWRNEQGQDLYITRLTCGDIFGEISMVLKKPAIATVIAATDVTLFVLKRELFFEIIKKYPNLLVTIYEIASKREDEIRRLPLI